jgi:hypothetical protein
LTNGSWAVKARKWNHVGASFKLLDNAVDSDARGWINAGSSSTADDNNFTFTVTDTFDGTVWVDSPNYTHSIIGAVITAADGDTTEAVDTTQNYKGFMYTFCILNQETMTGSPYFTGPTCATCGSYSCTNVDTECLYDYDFDKYEDGDCDTSC